MHLVWTPLIYTSPLINVYTPLYMFTPPVYTPLSNMYLVLIYGCSFHTLFNTPSPPPPPRSLYIGPATGGESPLSPSLFPLPTPSSTLTAHPSHNPSTPPLLPLNTSLNTPSFHTGPATGGESPLSPSLLPRDDSQSLGGKSFVYVPFAYHRPLTTSRDDAFLKFCRMKGITFDPDARIGTLFFHIDSVVSGALSLLSLASTRKRAVETAIQVLSYPSNIYFTDMNPTNRYPINIYPTH